MTATTGHTGRSWKRTLLWTIGIAVVVFILIQFVPYGRTSHSNPPATNAFQWNDPQAAAIATTSCYDCHSNETRWWWATNIAPFSWLVQHDVDGARRALNFSEWSGIPSTDELDRALGDNMPPAQYTLIHPGAKLTDAEKQTLLQGFQTSVAANGTSTGGQPGAAPSATPGTGGDAVAIIDQRCSACHAPDPALAFHTSSTADAQALIDSMIQQGAQVSPEEQQALVRYFTR